MGFSLVTVTETLIGSNGQPLAGVTVTAKLSGVIQNSGAAITNITRTDATNAKGVFTLRLPANTDQGTTPPGSYYTFECAAASLNSSVIVSPSPVPVRLFQLPAAPAAAGEIVSVFGRTGAVVAKTGDYTAAQVTGALAATPAAHLVALTATPAEIVEALIAAGLMKAS